MNVTKYFLPPRMRLFESHTSLWLSLRGSDVLVIEENDFRVFLPWTQIAQLEYVCVKRRFRNEIQVNYFLDRIEIDMSQSFMPDTTRLNVQSNRNRNFIVRRIHYIEMKKAITNKAFSNEDIRLGDYKFIGFLDNPIASSKKWRLADQISLKCGYM